MNPEVGTILDLSMRKIAGGVNEHGAAFAQGTVSLLSTVLTMAAKEYDRGADIRFAENRDLRALFGEIAGAVGDAGLKARLQAAAASRDADLRISTLNENNYALRRLLTEAMIFVELHGLRDAEKRIWAVLKAAATRRLVQLGA
ncbi:MAG: hypothetical protein WDM86_10990 [Rhizomicrobium sp.]